MNPNETEKIKTFCHENRINHYTINDDYSVDVTQDVVIKKIGRQLPFQFNEIYGDFNISGFNLQTLKGSPRMVRGFFDCSYNSLKSLEYGPKSVLRNFDCSYNILTSLEHSPIDVYDILANHNNLTTMDYISPKIKGSIMVNHNFLTSLIGCPEVLGGSLHCAFNQLTSMQGAPRKIFGNLSCNNNQIQYFNNEWTFADGVDISYNPIKSVKGLPLSANLWFEDDDIVKYAQELFDIGYIPELIHIRKKDILTRMHAEYRLYTINNIVKHVIS